MPWGCMNSRRALSMRGSLSCPYHRMMFTTLRGHARSASRCHHARSGDHFPIRRAVLNARERPMAKSAAATNEFDCEVTRKLLKKIDEADLASLGDLPLRCATTVSAMGTVSATVQ